MYLNRPPSCLQALHCVVNVADALETVSRGEDTIEHLGPQLNGDDT